MEEDLRKEREDPVERNIEDTESSLSVVADIEKDDSSISDLEAAHISEQAPAISRLTTQYTQHSAPAAHRVVTAQDWTGPDDPENPHNWPLWKRIWHTIPPGLFAFSVYASLVSLPYFPVIASDSPLLVPSAPPSTPQATMKSPHNSTFQVPLPSSDSLSTLSA